MVGGKLEVLGGKAESGGRGRNGWLLVAKTYSEVYLVVIGRIEVSMLVEF